ncbi:MAG: glycosyl hydrolase, partial [Bacteroidota bacterium]
WDAPILVSSHAPNRIYFASQRVWKSEDRGDSWTAISSDLTRNEDRMQMPILGQKWSWDAQWDFNAMSVYNTITSLSESPKQAGLLYAGTDDGIVQVTNNGGQDWTKIETGSMPGVPGTAFINDVKADLHDANTVYVAMDNHKYGDFKPYLLKSTDQGKSWKSITGNIPDRHLIWRMVQDHVNPNLLFAATEFGIYFTLDGGEYWSKLKGSPTIPFRDIVIQKRENDLVGASFGRSFFVLDNYAPLREVNPELKEQEATLFAVKDAKWYLQRSLGGSQGSAYYSAPNPAYGATFTYYLSEGLTTKKSERMKDEKKADELSFPSWDDLEAERRQPKPKIWLTIKDQEGKVVRRMTGPSSKGMHRVAWDFRYNGKNGIRLGQSSRGWFGRGFMAMPGSYTVALSKEIDGKITQLTDPVNFKVERLRKGALPEQAPQSIMAFREEMEDFLQSYSAVNVMMDQSMDKVKAMQTALSRSDVDNPGLNEQLYTIMQDLHNINEEMNGNRSKSTIGERNKPTIGSRMSVAFRGMNTTYGPTKTHRASLKIAQDELASMQGKVEAVNSQIEELEAPLQAAGAPWIEGQAAPNKNK